MSSVSVSASACKQKKVIMTELPATICLYHCSSWASVIRYNTVKCRSAVTFLQGRWKLVALSHLLFCSVWGNVWRMMRQWRERDSEGWGRIELEQTEAWWDKTEPKIMKVNKPYWSAGLEDKEESEWERQRERVDGRKKIMALAQVKCLWQEAFRWGKITDNGMKITAEVAMLTKIFFYSSHVS